MTLSVVSDLWAVMVPDDIRLPSPSGLEPNTTWPSGRLLQREKSARSSSVANRGSYTSQAALSVCRIIPRPLRGHHAFQQFRGSSRTPGLIHEVYRGDLPTRGNTDTGRERSLPLARRYFPGVARPTCLCGSCGRDGHRSPAPPCQVPPGRGRAFAVLEG